MSGDLARLEAVESENGNVIAFPSVSGHLKAVPGRNERRRDWSLFQLRLETEFRGPRRQLQFWSTAPTQWR